MMLCPFSKHKHVLGIPNKGFHNLHFLGTAVLDYIATIILSIITTWLTKIPLVLTTIGWFVIGLILHVLFAVPTDAVKFLGLNC